MKREVERERTLPAFSIDLGELEALWIRLTGLFEKTDKIYSSIELKLPNETLRFDNIHELKQYPYLKGRIREFSLMLSHNDRQVWIRSHRIVNPQAVVTARAETEAWCAGATETAYSFLQSYRVWFHWFVSAPIGWILLSLANAPGLLRLAFPHSFAPNTTFYAAWLVTLLALGILYGFRRKLFPAVTLRITEEESFIRRHSAELSLVVALISAALTALGLYLGK